MSPGRPIKRGQYIIFRIAPTDSVKPMRLFLTEGQSWTHHQKYARKGTYSAMKAVLSRIKTEFPDVILEECQK